MHARDVCVPGAQPGHAPCPEGSHPRAGGHSRPTVRVVKTQSLGRPRAFQNVVLMYRLRCSMLHTVSSFSSTYSGLFFCMNWEQMALGDWLPECPGHLPSWGSPGELPPNLEGLFPGGSLRASLSPTVTCLQRPSHKHLHLLRPPFSCEDPTDPHRRPLPGLSHEGPSPETSAHWAPLTASESPWFPRPPRPHPQKTQLQLGSQAVHWGVQGSEPFPQLAGSLPRPSSAVRKRGR